MKLEKIIDKFINIFSFILFSWIFILLIFFGRNSFYASQKIFLISNGILIIIGLLIILFEKKYKKKNKKEYNYDKYVKIMVFILFFVQIFLFYNAFFETAWDSGVVSNDARILATGSDVYGNNRVYLLYYSVHPNNVLYTLIVTLVLRINGFLGLFVNQYNLMSMVLVNSIISSVSSYLVYKIGKELFSKKIAFFGYLVSVILLVLSPWNMISYTDSFGLFIPILILFLYLNSKLSLYIKYPLIVLLTYFGYLIKPQTVIIVIAIVIIELIKNIKNIKKFNLIKLEKLIRILCISIISLIAVILSLNFIYKKQGFILDKEKRLGYTHYLMMGTNKERNGDWSFYDADFSIRQETYEIRKKENLRVFKERIKEYGFKGYFELLSKKLLNAYNDGTFAWGEEGNFFAVIYPDVTLVSSFIKNVYYGNYFGYYGTVMQFIWINLLLVIFINTIVMVFKKHKIDYLYLIMILTFIGITLFELLFEVRARYLYTNIPIFILLMMYGINNINSFKFMKRRKKNEI